MSNEDFVELALAFSTGGAVVVAEVVPPELQRIVELLNEAVT